MLERSHVFRTKREISAAKTSQSKEDVTSYAKQINLEHEEKGNDPEENTYQDNTKEKRKVSRKVADSVISTDFHPLDAKGSFDRDNVFGYLNPQRSSEESEEVDEEVDEEATERDKNEEASNLVRLPRNTNSDLDRYTDQDEKSSLYDDYEAKDVAKRGVLKGPEDYEEIEDYSPGISEDTAAVQESMSGAEKRESQKDARVKRNQVEISEMFERSKSSPDDPAKLEESQTATKNPYSREVSRMELSKGFNEASVPDDTSKIKDFGSKDVTSKLSDSSKIEEPTNKVTSSKKDESNAEYEKRIEEEIQRKIDSLKEEIQRDIETQQRIRDIEDNNARFDELQDQEHEDEERKNFKGELIEKRQTVVKRPIREIADDETAGFSRRNEKGRFLKREVHEKRQHESSQSDSKENKKLKRQFVVKSDDKSSEQIPSKGLSKKKRERVRQIFLVNNDQAEKRQPRSYTLPFDRTAAGQPLENELFMNPDSNSYLYTDNKMVRLIVNEKTD